MPCAIADCPLPIANRAGIALSVVDTPPEAGAGTIQISAAQMRELMGTPAPAPAPPPPPTFNMPAAEEFSTPSPRPAVAPPPPPPPPVAPAAEEGRPSTQYIPPAGVGLRSTTAPQTEDTKKHDEARRFARLLVSEIKLYNETKVDAGRKNKDLYERLKEDIDRSRQMYDERIPDEVRKVSNYFYDELVRILADGHAESLGL